MAGGGGTSSVSFVSKMLFFPTNHFTVSSSSPLPHLVRPEEEVELPWLRVHREAAHEQSANLEGKKEDIENLCTFSECTYNFPKLYLLERKSVLAFTHPLPLFFLHCQKSADVNTVKEKI